MKLLFFLFSFLCSVAYGQISIQELISESKMDSEGFEIYALNKGFSFYKLVNDEDFKGIAMFNGGEDGNERYLIWYSKFFNDKNHSSYQTANTSELEKLYKELGSLGFKLDRRGEFEEFYTKDYSRGKENVAIFIKTDWVEIAYSSSE
tara:strand:+ start:396 stop:839 length:444 start_codon:yes stop_codon:yes gene_type:complete